MNQALERQKDSLFVSYHFWSEATLNSSFVTLLNTGRCFAPSRGRCVCACVCVAMSYTVSALLCLFIFLPLEDDFNVPSLSTYMRYRVNHLEEGLG